MEKNACNGTLNYQVNGLFIIGNSCFIKMTLRQNRLNQMNLKKIDNICFKIELSIIT